MGYNAGGTYFGNHRSSGFDTVANDVACVVELTRSKRQAVNMMPTTGVMEFRTNEMIMQRTAPCRKHYDRDRDVIQDDTFSMRVETCPCNLNQARNDPWFIADIMFRPNSTCYIQRSAVSVTSLLGGSISYGQQCCYNIISG